MIDFDTAMNISSEDYQKKYAKLHNKENIEKLKNLYNHNHFSKIKRSNTPKIPKIIHQIWVGPKPVPEFLKILSLSWKDTHPDWEYILWTNETADTLVTNMRPDHQIIYHTAQSMRARANILRYYLLYWYGGLYVDADFRCLQCFEELNHYYDFYVGIAPNDAMAICNNALIASIPEHPIMKYIIDNAKYIENQYQIFSIGVFYFSKALLKIINSTSGTNIALPTNIFYSLPRHFEEHKIKDYIFSESMAIHYWANDSNHDYEQKDLW
jgi:mannosyltransferase OCH1-like enzyme